MQQPYGIYTIVLKNIVFIFCLSGSWSSLKDIDYETTGYVANAMFVHLKAIHKVSKVFVMIIERS